MTLLFGTDIGTLVGDIMLSVQGGTDMVLVKTVQAPADPAAPTAAPPPTTTRHSCYGIDEQGKRKTPSGDAVEYGDFVYIYRSTLPAGVVPAVGDRIEFSKPSTGRRSFIVAAISVDPADAVYECEVRE